MLVMFYIHLRACTFLSRVPTRFYRPLAEKGLVQVRRGKLRLDSVVLSCTASLLNHVYIVQICNDSNYNLLTKITIFIIFNFLFLMNWGKIYLTKIYHFNHF